MNNLRDGLPYPYTEDDAEEYSGGSIIKGFLLGTIDDNNNLHFDYRHINTEGESKSGECHSEPRFENGKLRFYEKWKWTSGCEGT